MVASIRNQLSVQDLAYLQGKFGLEANQIRPLSQNQRAMWFLQQAEPENSIYNIGFTAHIQSRLDIDALHKALQSIVDRHESLHTNFVSHNWEPVRLVQHDQAVNFEIVDAAGWSTATLENAVTETLHQPFDLAADNVFRVKLYTLEKGRYALQFVVHHIAVDGWSIWIILDELRRHLDIAHTSKQYTKPLPPLKYEYDDFIVWQREMLAGVDGHNMRDFWAAELAGDMPSLELPVDNRQASGQAFRKSNVQFLIEPELTRALRELALEEGGSLYSALLVAFQLFLGNYSDQQDILVGTPVHGRAQFRFSKIVGNFTNIAPMRGQIDPRESFRALLMQSNNNVKEVLLNQHYPIALLPELLQSSGENARQRLIQIGFNFLKPPRSLKDVIALSLDDTQTHLLEFGGLILTGLDLDLGYGVGQADIFLDLFDIQDYVAGTLNYNAAMFEKDTISSMVEQFERMLKAVAASPDAAIVDLNVMLGEKQNKLPVSPVVANGEGNGRPQPETELKLPAVVDKQPRTEVELLVAEIWSDVLGIPTITTNSSFFELGGHSLSATQIITRIHAQTGVLLSLRELFEDPTVSGMVAKIVAARRQSSTYEIPPITARTQEQLVPLSFAQERLWFLNQFLQDDSAYHISNVLHFEGPFDLEAAQKAFNAIIARHEVLRTIFPIFGGVPYQQILPDYTYEIQFIDLPADGNEEERWDKAMAIILQDSSRIFDLESTPPMRHFVLRLDEQNHLSYVIFHHIIFDQWSNGIFWNEYRAYYEHYLSDKELLLPDMALHYADFAVWQRAWLKGDVLERELSFWREQLRGSTVLELPADRPRPAVNTNVGSLKQLFIPADLLEKVEQLAKNEHVSLFILLLTIFKLMLMRYTGHTDIAVGVPVANRHHLAVENILGSFVNLLVMRSDLSGDLTFGELLTRVKDVALDTYAYQDMPFEKLIEDILVKRDPAYAPLVQVLFNMVNAPFQLQFMPGLEVEIIDFDRGAAQFDLSFTVNLQLDELVTPQIAVEYNTDIFDGETIERMLSHYQLLMEEVVADPHRAIDQYEILTQFEKFQLLDAWNNTKTAFELSRRVHHLFEDLAARNPQAPAATFEETTWTYGELDNRANQFARYLRRRGAAPGDLIGLGAERSLTMVAALLGIWKAGCAYVPLDPDYPEERLAFILEDANASLLVSQSTLSHKWTSYQGGIVYLDRDWDEISQESEENPLVRGLSAEDRAYVIHTSGSTGKPKGVQISHRNTLNFLLSMQQKPGLAADDILLAVTTLSFDISVLELFLPLISGAQVVLANWEVVRDGKRLARLIEDSRATVMQATPATWNLLLASGWQGCHTLKVLCGGEAMPRELAELLLSKVAELWNMYGPTETTVWSTIYQVAATTNQIPIGRPIANTQIYLLDQGMRPVPIGVPGELHIGGQGVSHGYLNRPALTAERFIPDPFSDDPEARLYKTGDSARYLPDGNIEFIGRLDHQVKIRGFRIELGEIEAVLDQHATVAQSVAVVQGDEIGDKRIIAYYIPSGDVPLAVNFLRDHVRKSLPAYMVPSLFVAMDAFPLTPNLKVDRQALVHQQQIRPLLETAFVSPTTETESILVEMWHELLSVDMIGTRDDFFELGGHSLLAVRLFAQIEEKFGVSIPLTSLFEEASVQHLARHIDEQPEIRGWSSTVTITPEEGHQRPRFFGVHGLTGDVYWFESLALHMGSDQPFYGLQSQGLGGILEPLSTIEDMAAQYLDEVCQLQPEGPYYIGGYSLGANIAYEMALQLERQGETVALLALIDHMPANSDFYEFRWNPRFVANLLRNLPYRLQDLLLLPRSEIVARVKKKLRGTRRVMRSRIQGETTDEQLELEARDLIDNADLFPTHMQHVIEQNYHAWQAYHPEPYTGHITLLRARGGRLFCSHDPEMGWGKLTDGGVTVYEIPGSHLRIFKKPYVQILAEKMRHSIGMAQEEYEDQ